MKCVLNVLCAVLAVVCLAGHVTSSGAGRAFPIESENYAVQLFRTINEGIEWDPTNFLVDLSGLYANCRFVGKRGPEAVDRATPEGNSILAIIDDTAGEEMYADAVNEYIRKVLDSWMHNNIFRTKINEADRFGCSVRPGCDGRTVVSCLLSPGNGGAQPIISTTRWPQNPTQAAPHAYSFTTDQYDDAEDITGNHWDRSHFLENLSGLETSCSMITASKWEFATAVAEGEARGKRLLGLYGAELNRGQTGPAMDRILRGFKEIPGAASVGCSVIPDCMYGRGDTRRMYVVVSCVYEE